MNLIMNRLYFLGNLGSNEDIPGPGFVGEELHQLAQSHGAGHASTEQWGGTGSWRSVRDR